MINRSEYVPTYETVSNVVINLHLETVLKQKKSLTQYYWVLS